MSDTCTDDSELLARAKELHVEVDMLLPKHRVCGDCVHILRCQRLFGCKWANRACDWSPSRFVRRLDTECPSHPIRPLTDAERSER